MKKFDKIEKSVILQGFLHSKIGEKEIYDREILAKFSKNLRK